MLDILISGLYELVEGKGGFGLVVCYVIWEGGKVIGVVVIVFDVVLLLC